MKISISTGTALCRNLFITLIISVALGACSSNKKAVGASGTQRMSTEGMSPIDALASKYSEWQTFYAPFTMRTSSPMSLSLSGRATMVRNEYIHLSMRILGFEVAAVYIDSDSVIFADKYHKMLVSEPFSKLTARMGLTVGDIQDVLLGRAFFPGEGSLGTIDNPSQLFATIDNGENTLLMPRRLPDELAWYFAIDSGPDVRQLAVQPADLEPFIADFSEITASDAGPVASVVEIVGNINGKVIEAACLWNLGKAKWNEPVSAPSVSFPGYKRLSASEIMGALKQM